MMGSLELWRCGLHRAMGAKVSAVEVWDVVGDQVFSFIMAWLLWRGKAHMTLPFH